MSRTAEAALARHVHQLECLNLVSVLEQDSQPFWVWKRLGIPVLTVLLSRPDPTRLEAYLRLPGYVLASLTLDHGIIDAAGVPQDKE